MINKIRKEIEGRKKGGRNEQRKLLAKGGKIRGRKKVGRKKQRKRLVKRGETGG